jgi:hypothetical protein
VRDPRELEIPPAGIVPFEDPETGEVIFVDTFRLDFRRNYAELVQAQQTDTEQLFRQMKIDFVNIETNKPYLDAIVQLFRRRAHRY